MDIIKLYIRQSIKKRKYLNLHTSDGVDNQHNIELVQLDLRTKIVEDTIISLRSRCLNFSDRHDKSGLRH